MPVDCTHLEQLNCQYAFYFRPEGQPPQLYRNCARFPAASVIKVPVLLAWTVLERKGEVDRVELCCLDDEPQVQGAGLSWLLRSRRLPYQDVLLLMVALSDNLCANLVVQRIGLERLNAIFRQELGLAGTEINRKLMDFEARSRGLDNWITIADAIHLFDLVHNLSPVEKAWIEPILLANQSDHFLKRDIPVDSLDFFHKTGSISGVLHDWGYTRRCDIFLFTQQVKDVPAVLRVFGELGKLMAAS